jgi:hypothetical protein
MATPRLAVRLRPSCYDGWTPNQSGILRAVYPIGGRHFVNALLPKRSSAAIRTRAVAEAIPMRGRSGRRSRLQKDSTAKLAALAANFTTSELAEHIAALDVVSIANLCAALTPLEVIAQGGISVTTAHLDGAGGHWGKADRETLADLWSIRPPLSCAEIGLRMGRTASAVQTAASRIALGHRFKTDQPARRLRDCITCDERFMSAGSGNRMCPHCLLTCSSVAA